MRLHYTVHRAEPGADWVVLVPGAGVHSGIWDPQVDAFRNRFNLLLPDLRGHGRSSSPRDPGDPNPYTWEEVSHDVLALMDDLGIERAHFVGVSMGCLVTRTLAEIAPERVLSMVLAGAIGRLDRRARTLIALAQLLKNVVPYLWLYTVYAWILLPRPGHAESRARVIHQARSLGRAEFLRWLPLARSLPRYLQRLEAHDPGIPALYVMGDQDHMFLDGVRAVAAAHESARFHLIPDCGHVCTLQCAPTFNRVALDFLARMASDAPRQQDVS
ncbi:MAG: alpha/beta fold hydrolase [Gemmatimonadota bacterium]